MKLYKYQDCYIIYKLDNNDDAINNYICQFVLTESWQKVFIDDSYYFLDQDDFDEHKETISILCDGEMEFIDYTPKHHKEKIKEWHIYRENIK